MASNSPSIDPNTGYCSATKTFHSIRPTIPLPSPSLPLSSTSYSFSLLLSSSSSFSSSALIDSTTSQCFSFYQYLETIQTLSSSLKTLFPSLSKGQTAFILSPPSVNIPLLYFSLLSLGVVISPSNPSNTPSEISHQIHLCSPVVAFATSSTAHNLPSSLPTLLLDSPSFFSMLIPRGNETHIPEFLQRPTDVLQSDPAAILYSSGTTGRVKGVVLTHRNLIAMVASAFAGRRERPSPVVAMVTVPLFHVYGLVYCIRAAALGETIVVPTGERRFELGRMLRAVEKFKVTHLPVAPPLVVALVKGNMPVQYDLRSLELVLCGGAPLGKEIIERFQSRFPRVHLAQAYGLTESTAGVFRAVSHEETQHYGSVGRLAASCEAKIVDPIIGIALPPGKQGELWIRGPIIMKGYIGDEAATAAALDSEGWLKTGDLCYIDNDGCLYVVDRLKELIKYKGYQVAPAELEHLLLSHPEIIETAVVPYPDEEAGQVPMAFVVRQPKSTLNEEEVVDFISKQVAPYKKIRRVSFISSIPKNPSGKILRKELVKLATSGFASSRL